MIVASFGLTQTGSVRKDNQDSLLIDEDAGLFAVADGLGGLPNGAAASRITLALLRDAISQDPAASLERILEQVNLQASRTGFELNESGFGTTLTVLRMVDSGRYAEIGHVGDSAAYRVRQGEAELLTSEHTVAARLMADISRGSWEDIPPAAHHTLTQCIGQRQALAPEVMKISIHSGDRIFLLTDGVTKSMREADLLKALALVAPIDQTCQRLSFQVEAAGSPDNYTMVALQFG